MKEENFFLLNTSKALIAFIKANIFFSEFMDNFILNRVSNSMAYGYLERKKKKKRTLVFIYLYL